VLNERTVGASVNAAMVSGGCGVGGGPVLSAHFASAPFSRLVSADAAVVVVRAVRIGAGVSLMYTKSTVPVLAVTGIPVALLAGTAVALIVSGVLLVLLSAGVFARRRRLRTLGVFSEPAEPPAGASFASPRLPWPVLLGLLCAGWAAATMVPTTGLSLGPPSGRFQRVRQAVSGRFGCCLRRPWPAGGWRPERTTSDLGKSPIVSVAWALADRRRPSLAVTAGATRDHVVTAELRSRTS
jgi:hypothetical protein